MRTHSFCGGAEKAASAGDYLDRSHGGKAAVISFAVMGRIQVVSGERRLGPKELGGIKAKQILEILILERGHAVSKDRLADMLWGDNLPNDYIAALESHVSVLRSRLQPKTKSSQSVIRTEPGGYRLIEDHVTIDLDRFDSLVDRAGTARPRQALALLTAAVELINGDVLEDEVKAEWAHDIRRRYRVRYVEALVAVAEACLRAGQPERAVAHATKALDIDPLCEAACRAAMQAHYQLGRDETATAVFEQCKVRLDSDLGVPPLAATRALHDAIVAGDPSLRAVAGPTDSAATTLLGRADELAVLTSHIQAAMSGSQAVMVIEGQSGSGKSTLVDAGLASLGSLPVARVQCRAADRLFPGLALTSALSRLAGLAPIALDELSIASAAAQAAGDALPSADVLDQLTAALLQAGPFALIIDGSEHADDMSMAILEHIRSACAHAPIAIVVLSTEGWAEAAWRRLSPEIHVRLAALNETDLAGAPVADLFSRTGGQPRLVAAFMEASVPGLDEAASRGRLGELLCRPLSAGERRVLTAASVLDRPFAVGDVPVADHHDVESHLENLCAHGLLQRRDASYEFRHETVRASVAATLSVARRSVLTALSAAA